MFELVLMEDNVKIEPVFFDRDLAESCKQQLNRKLANKVFHKAGLCIGLHDIIKIGDSLLLPGDGACRKWLKNVFENIYEKFDIKIEKKNNNSARNVL
jgi:DNA-directed RNA polymerase III subunit RPC8